eukprot:7131492-Prymnesium_polylepis.1
MPYRGRHAKQVPNRAPTYYCTRINGVSAWEVYLRCTGCTVRSRRAPHELRLKLHIDENFLNRSEDARTRLGWQHE